MTWFERLVGFKERDPKQVRRNFTVDGETMVSKANGVRLRFGRLETPSLEALRMTTPEDCGQLRVAELVGDAKALHNTPANADALFQVASQFNLLEMVGPGVTPEKGVGCYEGDPTQGPACAIAAGAGTIYRNYFVELGDQVGQTADRQIDCLADVGAALGNDHGALWAMRNGYALPSKDGLAKASAQIRAMDEQARDALRGKLRIGLQLDTMVTLNGAEHLVNQAYCSALPVAYSGLPANDWEPLARLVLEAAYEATLWAAVQNRQRTGVRRVFLTMLGGGAFGNDRPWIIDAIRRACERHRKSDLDVAIVSYRSSQTDVRALAREFA